MKKAIRNLLAVALTASMILPAAACKKTKNTASEESGSSEAANADASDDNDSDDGADKDADADTDADADKATSGTLKQNPIRTISADDPYYKSEYTELKLDPVEGVTFATKEFVNASIVGDRILVTVNVTLKDGSSEENLLAKNYWARDAVLYTSLQLFDLNGNCIAILPMEQDCEFQRAYEMEKDEILVMAAKYDYGECKAKPAFFVMSPSGEKIRDLQFDIKGDIYEMQAYPLDNGNIFVAARGAIYLFDAEGKLIKQNKADSLGPLMNHSDGKWYVAQMIPPYYTIGAFQEVDVNTGELKETYKVDKEIIPYLQKSTECLIFSEEGVAQFNIEQNKSTQILSPENSDIYCAHLTCGRIESDGSMLFVNAEPDKDNDKANTDCYCYYANTMSVVRLTPADKNSQAGKVLLKLALSADTDPYFTETIRRYNADPANHAYIEVVTISDENYMFHLDTERNQLLGNSAKLAAKDMYEGTGADILVGFSGLSELNDGKLLLDLKPYLEADSSIKKEDYFDNIFSAFEKDGKLYSFPLTYTINGMRVNRNVVDAKQKWTFADIDKMSSKLPTGKRIFPEYSCEDMLLLMLTSSSSDFINYEKGEVDFNSDSFKAMLQTAKNYCVPEPEYNDGIIKQGDRIIFPFEQFDEDMTAAEKIYITSMQDYYDLIYSAQGQKTVFAGYPSAEGKSLTAYGGLTISITKCASDPDIAWEFIRYCLNDETQEYLSTGMVTLPVSRKVLNKSIEDFNGAKYAEYERDPVGYGDPPLLIDDEKKVELVDMISSIDNAYYLDSGLMTAILTESDRYFKDWETLDNVCDALQKEATEIMKSR